MVGISMNLILMHACIYDEYIYDGANLSPTGCGFIAHKSTNIAYINVCNSWKYTPSKIAKTYNPLQSLKSRPGKKTSRVLRSPSATGGCIASTSPTILVDHYIITTP